MIFGIHGGKKSRKARIVVACDLVSAVIRDCIRVIIVRVGTSDQGSVESVPCLTGLVHVVAVRPLGSPVVRVLGIFFSEADLIRKTRGAQSVVSL